MAVGWGVGGWKEEGWWLEGEAMEHDCGVGSWWLGRGGLWLEGVRDVAWLWDGELVAGRWRASGCRVNDGAWLWDGDLVSGRMRIGGSRVEGWSVAVGGWGVVVGRRRLVAEG